MKIVYCLYYAIEVLYRCELTCILVVRWFMCVFSCDHKVIDVLAVELLKTSSSNSQTVKLFISSLSTHSLQSSIGDVKTLRSQLHARRTTLNEEIGKEDHILQGSKKLVGATLDHKTKDQATLEMSFAESKIKALQSELAKINSSLHAYQDERFVDLQVTFSFCNMHQYENFS